MARLSDWRRKKQTKKIVETKKVQENRITPKNINETTLNPKCNLSVCVNDPIVLEFYRALKNQKAFGDFCQRYKIHSIDAINKRRSMCHLIANVGDLRIQNELDCDFLKKVRILQRMTETLYSEDAPFPLKKMRLLPKTYFFELYAKDYFANNPPKVKHTNWFYQIVGGTTSMLLFLLAIFGLMHFILGTNLTILLFIFVAISILSIFVAYRFANFIYF